MAISIKHGFQSLKADGVDTTLIQPSSWNAEHAITLAAGKVLGRDTSSSGAMQELPLAFDPTGQSMVIPVGTTAQRPAVPAVGMMRYNTTTSTFEGYSASGWASLYVPARVYVGQVFTAIAAQTTFTVTGGYAAGQIDVYQNGVRLTPVSDVDISGGTSVVLVTGATLGDTIVVSGYK